MTDESASASNPSPLTALIRTLPDIIDRYKEDHNKSDRVRERGAELFNFAVAISQLTGCRDYRAKMAPDVYEVLVKGCASEEGTKAIKDLANKWKVTGDCALDDILASHSFFALLQLAAIPPQERKGRLNIKTLKTIVSPSGTIKVEYPNGAITDAT